jgi:hypothetical protein
MAKIIFNGQEYESVEAMPAEVRQLYEMANQMFADQDQDGVPDLFEKLPGSASTVVTHSTQFVVDGQVYSNVDELPPEARRKYEQTMGRLDANRNGIPDLLEGNPFGTAAPSPSATATPPPFPQPHVQVIGETRPLNVRWLVIGVAIVLLIGIVAFVLLSR